MGKRKSTRRQRRVCPDHRKTARISASGEEAAPAFLRNRTESDLCRQEQSEPFFRKEESFASLFGKEKTLQESFSVLMEDYLEVPAEMDARQEKRQKSGPAPADRLRAYPAPQEELDLHRLTGPEAQQRIENFVQTARGRGSLTLRIITGRGLHSEGPAVLPSVTESKLLELKERGLVLAFRWDGKKKEKNGAVIVYLQHH